MGFCIISFTCVQTDATSTCWAFSSFLIVFASLLPCLKVDKASATVKAEAGVTLKHLNEVELAHHGLALSSLGAVSDITLGGAIATGVHGSGGNYGIFSTQVQEMEIVTSDGRKMCCSRTEEEEVFLAACCGLGSVGIVITVTLLCEPGFRLRENRYACELSQVCEDFLSNSGLVTRPKMRLSKC